MKNRNPLVRALFVAGIVLAVVIGVVIVLNILVSTVGSSVLTNIVREQLEKNAVKLPFTFTGLSVNPMLGEVSASGIYLPSSGAGSPDVKCGSVRVRVNPVDLIGFAANPNTSSLKSVEVFLEKPAMQAQEAGVQFACEEVSLRLDGTITQAMIASMTNGDLLALLSTDQKVNVKARGVDMAFILPNIDPEVRPLLQKAFDFEKADLDITSDAKSGALAIKSDGFSSSAFEGSLDGTLTLNKSNMALSRLTNCSLKGTVKDETLKSYFLRLSKDQPGLVKMDGNSVELFVSGTIANPVLHK